MQRIDRAHLHRRGGAGRVILAVVVAVAAALAVPRPADARRAYPTAEAAAEALVGGIMRRDRTAIEAALGRDYLRALGLSRIDPDDRADFLAAWKEHHRVRHLGRDRAVIEAGKEGWTFPIPLVRGKAGWTFDVRAGRDILRARRIGRNELAAMQAALAYYDAQREYAEIDRDRDGVLEYAQRIPSTPGRHDGLFWPTAEGERPSPLGPLLAKHTPGEAYYGYRYRILRAQGPHAPGGMRDYVSRGDMTNGFALVAWPARYGDTGVMTFIINHDGKVYEKDLGPNTDAAVKRMDRYDPDRTWHRAKPIPQTR